MDRVRNVTGRVVAASVALAVLVAGHALAQDADEWTPLRTAWGDPDLQGVWRYEGTTPLERPADLAGRATLTDAELAEIARIEAERAANREAGLDGVAVGRRTLEESPIRGNEYNIFWQDHGRARQAYAQTSLIVDPSDGRLPYTDDARVAAQRSNARYGVGPYESYLDPDTGERCLTDGVTAIMWQGPNGGHNRIVQSQGYITILHEEYRDRRIIPVDGREPGSMPRWLGNAVGHWDGDTLVVETTNFLDRTNYEWASIWTRASESLQIVERFRRVSESEMQYTITVEDPQTFTRPWTAAVPITRLPDGVQIYEYACHEGNRAMPNLLSAGRVEAGLDPSAD
ncbi:MAG: hypothetical protein HKN84_09810 [Gammaproteobacteria bacterium]|nr:hypothetical protein [Gammaproteobacteria bacterium]